VKRPLLVIDGDSLAHRAYHALPKTIRRADRRPSNALVGFTNFLLGLWDSEQPRAVLVGWDTLEVPTYRHEAFESYQSGREFDADLLHDLPSDVDPCGENGEFHTFVYAGPGLRDPVRHERGRLVVRDGRFVYCDLVETASR